MVEKKLRVFISYSRKDLDFARRIFVALEARGVAPKIDERDLPKLEDWRRELLSFIREADAVVFIISPNSVSSPVCAWEIEQVAALNKRLAPIVFERVQDDRIPNAAAKLNYIFFDHDTDFDREADDLARALQTDIVWLKEHTRLGQLAGRWNERKRPGSLLLRGQDLLDAESWIGSRPNSAPLPTEMHRAFVARSRHGTTVRRVWTAAIMAAVVLLALGIWEGQAWLLVRNRINVQAYQNYLASALPLHLFGATAEQRISEDKELHQIPEGDINQYLTFTEAHKGSPYSTLAGIIFNRRINTRALKLVFSDSMSRELSYDDLAKLDCDDLLIARNEISYRLGHCFCTTWGNKYFPNSDCDGVVNTDDAALFSSNSMVGIPDVNWKLLEKEYNNRKCVFPKLEYSACGDRH